MKVQIVFSLQRNQSDELVFFLRTINCFLESRFNSLRFEMEGAGLSVFLIISRSTSETV